jgi:metalloendopeptidase OMA1, mitochondrial
MWRSSICQLAAHARFDRPKSCLPGRFSAAEEKAMDRRDALGRRGIWLLGMCLAVILASGGCQTNPYTGRPQLLMIPPSQDMQLGLQAYRQMLTDPRIQKSTDPRVTAPVQRVAARVIEASRQSKYAAIQNKAA